MESPENNPLPPNPEISGLGGRNPKSSRSADRAARRPAISAAGCVPDARRHPLWVYGPDGAFGNWAFLSYREWDVFILPGAGHHQLILEARYELIPARKY